jgi:NAD(P)-dependent dehydrogenase (short-subunit alcohol dehydrogenase family)
MPDLVAHIGRARRAEIPGSPGFRPRVLITGACQGTGRACAEALASRGSELILCDVDQACLAEIADAVGAAGQIHCDVASEASVATFATEVADRYESLDMIINAAGGGYARTLGMYRVSRALLPMLQHGVHKLLINVPPAPQDADAPTFPYASSRLAFQRLSSALAFEARGTSVTVLIACPDKRQLMHAIPDPNAGTWAENCELRTPDSGDALTLAWQIASLFDVDSASRRHAG